MKPWQFSKPKTPGFGISADFYLSILCSTAMLPSIHEIVNPDGEGGAVEGFGAPLAGGQTDKSLLRAPCERGAYAIASKDRKTVLKMLILQRDESAFDPEVFAQSSLARDADPELVARVRATWNLAQLTFESHHPMVYPALDFFLGIARRLAALTDGAVADPIAQRYLLPEEVMRDNRFDPRIDARDHIAVRFRRRPDGIHGYTLGMRKFNQPEYEVLNLLDGEQAIAQAFMIMLVQQVLLGDPTRPGDQYGAPGCQFEARDGALDREFWQETPAFELLPPTSKLAGDCLRAWVALLPD